MISNSNSPAIAGLNFENEASFSLGLKELLFLVTILFFGFCGFTVCVDKIYSVPKNYNEIESITVHDRDLSVISQSAVTPQHKRYSFSIEN